MILGVLRSKWPKGGGRPLYPQLRTFVRNVYLIAITLHNAQLSEKFFHVCLWLSFHWSCIFSHFDNTSDFSQRKQSHYEYQWKMFFSVKDSQSGISWLSFKITRVGREKQVNLGGILARKLMNSFEKAPTVLIVIRRSLHGQPFFFKKWEWRESDFATILKVQSLLFCCCDCNLRRHMGKHYWLSSSFMQECNLLHPISVLQDTFLRWILPIPFFSSSSASKQWKRITSFWPFWGERKVLAMDSWGCVCCFGYWEEFQSPTLLSSISPCLRHSCLGQKCSSMHSVPMNLFPPWNMHIRLQDTCARPRGPLSNTASLIRNVAAEARQCFLFPIQQAVVSMTLRKCLGFANLYIFIDLMCVSSSNICIVCIVHVILAPPVDRRGVSHLITTSCLNLIACEEVYF